MDYQEWNTDIDALTASACLHGESVGLEIPGTNISILNLRKADLQVHIGKSMTVPDSQVQGI